MLGFRQIGVAASQPSLRFPWHRHIRHRSKELDAAGWIRRRTSHGVDIFDRNISYQKSKLVFIGISVDGDTVDVLLEGSTIFRMGSLVNKFVGRFRRPVT